MPTPHALETIHGSIYDFPEYYDVLFGADWKEEFRFVRDCAGRYARCPVKRIFEPACGTGRLLIKLAQAGYGVAGNDLNPQAVAYCNRRLLRNGFAPSVEVGDMADFRTAHKFDLAFNFINTFRHLPTEQSAENHLRCVADGLRKGGVYLLGLHLIPRSTHRMESETWHARRGRVSIRSYMWCKNLDLKRRSEQLGMTLEVTLPSRQLKLVDEMDYRTYTAQQMNRLLQRLPEFEVVAAHDFQYDVQQSVRVGPKTEDVVYVLRRR